MPVGAAAERDVHLEIASGVSKPEQIAMVETLVPSEVHEPEAPWSRWKQPQDPSRAQCSLFAVENSKWPKPWTGPMRGWPNFNEFADG